jgi:ArsR family transcriptional regulator
MSTRDDDLTFLLRAIVDPTRRRILRVLASVESKDGLCAGDVEKRIGLSQPTISHHMTVLQDAGLVDVSREGQWRWYQRNDSTIRGLLKKLREEL